MPALKLFGYLVRRLVGMATLLVVIVVVTFVLISLAPGDVALTLAGPAGGDPGYLAGLRRQLGLDRPIFNQIGGYVIAVFRGDLGFSVVQGRPVLEVILGRLPATLLLAGAAIVIAAVLGTVLGTLAAARQGTRRDAAISVGSLMAYSLPVFWVGQLLIGLLAVRLDWLPTGGMTSVPKPTGVAYLADVALHLVLPAGVLSFLLLGLVVRTSRTAVIEVLGEDYMRTAKALGVGEARRLYRHAGPNALRPVITVVTSEAAVVFTGTILVETVFSWPGLGRLMFDSVLARDRPVLVGVLLFSAFVVSALNLLADLLYAALDPRVRLG